MKGGVETLEKALSRVKERVEEEEDSELEEEEEES